MAKNLVAGMCLAMLTGLLVTTSHAECEPGFIITGDNFAGELGEAVSGAGDVNNDGFDDFVVGAHKSGDIFSGDSFRGRVLVYSGKTMTVLYTLTGLESGDMFGGAVSGAGDVDNDGFADIIVGAAANKTGGSLAGQAYVYSGRTGALLYTFTGEAAGDYFGVSVSGGGDVDNDGFADVIVGADGNDVGGNIAGRAYVYSGKAGNLLYKFTGLSIGNELGNSVSGAGDVNNDGFDDLIVGAHNNAGINASGRADVYSGKTGEILYVFNGEANQDHFGSSVSGAGDVNNDGFDDLIIGAKWNSTWGPFAGRAYLYSGQDGALLYTFTGEVSGDQFGYSVSDAGDINFDGYADVVVGAPMHDAGGPDVGRVYIYSGQTGELLRTMTGEVTGDAFGVSVSNSGDINGNGYSNLIVGAPYNDVGPASSPFTSAGRSYVYFLCGICCATHGDANHDGRFNISDITFGIAWIFSGGAAPSCQDEADANGDNTFNISDITYAIARVFGGGPAPICGTNGF